MKTFLSHLLSAEIKQPVLTDRMDFSLSAMCFSLRLLLNPEYFYVIKVMMSTASTLQNFATKGITFDEFTLIKVYKIV